jgi:hypothetical protein
MIKLIITTILSLVVQAGAAFAEADGSWPGVDETVIERVASDCGRQAGSCGLALEGDAQLFLFLMAGVVGGFVLGYFYRKIFGERCCNRADGGGVGD